MPSERQVTVALTEADDELLMEIIVELRKRGVFKSKGTILLEMARLGIPFWEREKLSRPEKKTLKIRDKILNTRR